MATAIDPNPFRRALGTFTTGVTVITTVDRSGADVGITANSFNSVSLDPPMVLWSIDKSSSNLEAFTTATHFAVHVLASDQDELASRFATRGVDRFAGLAVERGTAGLPLLAGCAARFQCRMAFRYEGGDHTILVGEVLAFDHEAREPLVYKSGRYALAVAKAEEGAAEAATDASPGASAADFLIYQLGRAYHQILLRLQPELERRGIGVPEYFALSMLGIQDRRPLSELDALVSHTGVRITDDVGRKLILRGLARAEAQADSRLALTDAGERSLVELLAVAKAASEDAETGFDPSEARLLRQFLNRIIRATDPDSASRSRA